MSTKPLIAVAGAAGKQGRSVAAALLRSGGGGGGGACALSPEIRMPHRRVSWRRRVRRSSLRRFSGTGGDMAKGLSRSRRRFFDDAAHAAGELRRIRTRMPPG